jgi:hypothetical protein
MRGLTNVNLFAVDQTFTSSKIDTGTYSEIEFKLILEKSSSTSIPLVLKGSFTKTDGTIVPVELDVNDNVEIKSEAKNVVIDNTTDLKTTIILYLNKIFIGVTAAELDAATLTSGTLLVSSSSNTAIFNKAIANLVNIGGRDIEGEHHGHNGSDDTGSDDHGSGH